MLLEILERIHHKSFLVPSFSSELLSGSFSSSFASKWPHCLPNRAPNGIKTKLISLSILLQAFEPIRSDSIIRLAVRAVRNEFRRLMIRKECASCWELLREPLIGNLVENLIGELLGDSWLPTPIRN